MKNYNKGSSKKAAQQVDGEVKKDNLAMDPYVNVMAPNNVVSGQTPPVATNSTAPAAFQNNGDLQERTTNAAAAAAGIPSKTPVSVLQELLSRRGTTPKYELVQIEGAIHEPTFRYRVTVSDVVAVGTGRSKKEAKHAAAKAILDKLIGQNDASVAPGPGQAPIPDVTSQIVSPFDDKIPGNPIGTLQEMCMARRWPPPTYELRAEKGLPHERLFTIACVVFKHIETGTGKSKKLAKRQAAHKMWLKLQDLPVEQPNMPLGMEDDDEIAQRMSSSAAAHYSDLKDSKISTLTPPHSQKVSQFHKNLKSSAGPKLSELQNTSLTADSAFNYVKFLQDISVEQHFEVTYVDVEERARSGAIQCLVQLSTLPVAVCYGSGTTSKDAQAAAARNALEYLKIMTKK